MAAILSPFETLAAFIFSRNLDVSASNAGAQRVFGIKDSDSLDALSLPPEAKEAIGDELKTLFRDPDPSNRILKIEILGQPGTALFDYHVMGPITGAPVLYSHMEYCLACWHGPMIKAAFSAGLRVICPIRAGYRQSDNLHPDADVMATTRDDTMHILDHLGIDRLPYLTQGNDLIFAVDFASQYPDRINKIIGTCARPGLAGDKHYSGMAKWHRFYLSTAKHAPHLRLFTFKAALSMTRRIGHENMFRQTNRRSAGDMSLLEGKDLYPVLAANSQLVVGEDADVAQAYTMDILRSETDWSDLMLKCAEIKTWFVNGGKDPAVGLATIAEYREAYPWIEIEVLPDAGQLLIFQHYETLIPRFAEAAKRARYSRSGSD